MEREDDVQYFEIVKKLLGRLAKGEHTVQNFTYIK